MVWLTVHTNGLSPGSSVLKFPVSVALTGFVDEYAFATPSYRLLKMNAAPP